MNQINKNIKIENLLFHYHDYEWMFEAVSNPLHMRNIEFGKILILIFASLVLLGNTTVIQTFLL